MRTVRKMIFEILWFIRDCKSTEIYQREKNQTTTDTECVISSG